MKKTSNFLKGESVQNARRCCVQYGSASRTNYFGNFVQVNESRSITHTTLLTLHTLTSPHYIIIENNMKYLGNYGQYFHPANGTALLRFLFTVSV